MGYQPPVSVARRSRVEQYYHTVNWTDPRHVKKVFQVFENGLHRAEKLAEEPAFSGDWQVQRKKEVERS